MKLKISQSIPDLLRQLPEGSVAAYDIDCLFAVNRLIKQLDTAPSPEHDAPFLFTAEVRRALGVELIDAMAQIIKVRIPKNPVGRPRSTPPGEQAERSEAKAVADDERKELQSLKRAALEMREALEAFEKRAVFAAGREIAGMPADNEARERNLSPALDPVREALHTLKTTPCRYVHLWEQMKGMSENCEALERATSFWCNAQNVRAEGKAAGVHKGKALADWLEACKKLGRDIAEELRNLK